MTLREQHWLSVFEIRLLRPARKEVAEGWRKLHNKARHDWQSSQRRVRRRGYVAFMGTRKGAYTVLEAKPKKEIPHERQA